MMNIFLTGSSGFIGSSVLKRFYSSPFNITLLSRELNYDKFSFHDRIIGDLESLKLIESPLLEKLKAIDVVIHIAAKAHVVGTTLSSFHDINTSATLQLARNAAASGVKRFIFLSSIGVNGISNTKPFSVEDKPAPVEDYAVSKLDAEIGLRQISVETGMEVVIIRPPLVYGASAPGNFGKLASLAIRNLPLPLGSIHNKRSLVALDNLVDLIVTCIDHPKAANQTFLVSDDHDISTTELLTMMTCACGKKPRLLPVPVSWLKLVGKLTGKQAVTDRLCGNLQVDITHTKETLGWKPPISVEEGIRRCFTDSI